MDRDHAYVTSIPLEAEQRITEFHPDGAPWQAGYWLDGQRVGLRHFYPTGDLEHEHAYRDGVRHGMQYRWHAPGELLSAEPFERGVPHGTAYEWGHEGRLLGSYTLEHGTGIDLWWQEWDGTVFLAEVHPMQEGQPHGFEWWVNEDQQSVYVERHWQRWQLHGIEREWNSQDRLRRGYPRYWVAGERVTKRQYLKTAARDPTLPPFRPEENNPRRTFPPEIVPHLGPR